MSKPQQLIAPYGVFVFEQMERPFCYTVRLGGYPIGLMALRFGNLEILRQELRGCDDPYVVYEVDWEPAESVTDGLKALAQGAELRFPGLAFSDTYQAALELERYNSTAMFRG
jgi:hypothetical protein